MKHLMPQLPYSMEALSPHLSKETFDYHYGKHLQAYVDNLNKLIAGTEYEEMPLEEIIKKAEGGIFNNAAQAWNHTFYFMTFSPEKKEMPEALKQLIERDFGSVAQFKDQLKQAALSLFGSGWAWLVEDENKQLSILKEPNAGTPLTKGLKPILTVDVWEHAYYIDYRNNRGNYFEAIWNIIDWTKVAARI